MYVYYRVEPHLAAKAEAGVRELFAALRAAWPGLQTRLLHKVDDAHPGSATWMEIYEHPSGLSSACQAHVKELAQRLPPGLTGVRHVEVFASMPDAVRC
ncbi:MAG: hypothetical protein RI907_2873 [Pseudomonadota bacterium]|jgi:hypothetical protein